jgi:serine/threonine-protein kinase RsbW
MTNAVRHGGCEGMEDAVQIGLQIAGGAVQVEFRDRGQPFDPALAPPPKLDGPLDERGLGGLGLHLVRQVMTDFQYERAGEWNRITMRRPLTGA